MDYDQTDIAAVYDRGRDHGPEVQTLWTTALASHVHGRPPSVILDLGCGTGRFSHSLSTHFDARVVGVDPSRTMVAQACRKEHGPRVGYALGAGEAVPLRDRSVDLIFMSMVFHHFTHPAGVALECRRVLRDDGLVGIRTGTIDRAHEYPYVPFFPPSLPLIEARLPRAAWIREVFEAGGFQTIAATLIIQQIAPTYAAYVNKLASGADSILASLSPEDLDAGFQALRAHAARVDPTPVTEPIDFLVFRPSRP